MENLIDVNTRPPGEPVPDAQFQPTWRSAAGITTCTFALLAFGGAVLTAALAVGHALFPSAVAGIVTLLFAWIGWLGGRQVWGPRPVLGVDATGLSARSLKGEVLSWNAIADFELASQQGHAWLQVRLHPEPGRAQKRSFLTGLGSSERRIGLGGVRARDHARVFEAVLRAFRHWAPARAFEAAGATLVKQQAEAAFDIRLRAVTPRVWAMPLMVALCVGVWALNVASGMSAIKPTPEQLLRWGGNAASAVQDGQWWRLASGMFLHGGLMHLALNMLALWEAGLLLTRWFGNRGFLVVYLVSGLVGGALSLHFAAQSHVSVGASGAVFGVAGALLMAMIRHRGHFPAQRRKQLLTSLGIFIVYSLVQGLSSTGIDNAAHIGGLLTGLAAGWLLVEQFDDSASPSRRAARLGGTVALGLAAVIGLGALAPPATRDLVHFFGNVRTLQAVEAEVAAVANAFAKDRPRLDAGLRSGAVTPHAYANRVEPIVASLRGAAARLAALRWASADPFGDYARLEQRGYALSAEQAALQIRVLRGQAPPGFQARRDALSKEIVASRARSKILAEKLVKGTPDE